MIDKQATDKMAEMLALIKKYGKLGNKDVETEASSEYRRRAWVIAKMLSELTEHAAQSDFYNLMSDDVLRTDKERQRCHMVARQEDRAFMKVLCEFDERAKEFAEESAGTNEKTKTQLVHEIELLTSKFSTATAHLVHEQEAAKAKATKKKIKDVPAFVAKDATVIAAAATLKAVESEFAKANAAAAERGFAVKITKIRTVATNLETAKAPVLKAVKKEKKENEALEVKVAKKKAKPALKVVAKPAARPKGKPTSAKKAA